MPRVSMKKEDMMGGNFFKEGNVEITKCVCAVFQYPGRDGAEPGEPFPAVVLGFEQLGEDWSAQDGVEPQEIALRIGSLDKIRPGNLDDPSDLEAEPEDLGNEVGTEGNSIYGDEGSRLGFNWPEFVESLKKSGFKPNIIDRIYMPDYKGMKCHLKQVPTGRKYTAKDGTEKDAMQWVVSKIQTFPYEKKAGSKAGAGKAPAAGKTTAKATATTGTDEDAMSVAVGLLSDPSADFQKMVPSGQAIKRQTFQLQVNQEILRKKIKPPTVQAKIMALIKNDEALQELGAAAGFVVDLDTQTVIFP